MNFESFLEPIQADAPSGDDLSFSTEFDVIREKRREDDPSLAQGDWKRSLKVADWPGVVTQCEDLLRTRTKDLRVIGWFVDAVTRTRGFAGLADGLTLAARLCEAHWGALHPMADDDDQEQRIGSLAWLLGQISELTRLVPVLESSGKRLSLRDVDGARALQQQIGRGLVDAAGVAERGALTLDEVTRIQAGTPRQLLVANLAEVRRAGSALAHLEVVVDARLGVDGPSFAPARKALEEALASVERLAQDAGAVAESRLGDAAPSAPMAGPSGVGADATPAATGGPLQGRGEALQQLRRVAEFFRRTEPHSPVAYLADKAAQWGEMPLHAWLRVVLKDPNALAHVEELLGVEPRPAQE